jgi:hypothetical protein
VKGYVAGLRSLTTQHPKDLEARALLAIALLMEDGGTREQQKALTEESIALAQSVFAASPDHPGGAHYLIHAADNPQYASRGLAAARAYAKIAPDAEHALHMPSHIFVQVGAWNDVVSSNERAWAASRAWVKSHGVPNTELSFHSLWWLQHGYLQQGRLEAAKGLIDTVRSVLSGSTGRRPTQSTRAMRWSSSGSRTLAKAAIGPSTADAHRSGRRGIRRSPAAARHPTRTRRSTGSRWSPRCSATRRRLARSWTRCPSAP